MLRRGREHGSKEREWRSEGREDIKYTSSTTPPEALPWLRLLECVWRREVEMSVKASSVTSKQEKRLGRARRHHSHHHHLETC